MAPVEALRRRAAFAAALVLSAALLSSMLLGSDSSADRPTLLDEDLALDGPRPLTDAEMADVAAPSASPASPRVRVRRSAGGSGIERVEVPRSAYLGREWGGSWVARLGGSAEPEPRGTRDAAAERLLAKFLATKLQGDMVDRRRPESQAASSSNCDAACQLLKLLEPGVHHAAPDRAQRSTCGVSCVMHQLASLLLPGRKGGASHGPILQRGVASTEAELPFKPMRSDEVRIYSDADGGISGVVVPYDASVTDVSDGWVVHLSAARGDDESQTARGDDESQTARAGGVEAAMGRRGDAGRGDAPVQSPLDVNVEYHGKPQHSPVDVYEPNENPYWCLDGTNSWECGGPPRAARGGAAGGRAAPARRASGTDRGGDNGEGMRHDNPMGYSLGEGRRGAGWGGRDAVVLPARGADGQEPRELGAAWSSMVGGPGFESRPSARAAAGGARRWSSEAGAAPERRGGSEREEGEERPRDRRARGGERGWSGRGAAEGRGHSRERGGAELGPRGLREMEARFASRAPVQSLSAAPPRVAALAEKRAEDRVNAAAQARLAARAGRPPAASTASKAPAVARGATADGGAQAWLAGYGDAK